MIARIKHYLSLLAGLVLLTTSCTEDITMDMPEGRKVPVVEASITNEIKRHEAILSYSSELYNTEGFEMISGAEVYVVGGGDTIWYYEQEDNPGHYLTDSVAGIKNRRYHLEINVEDNTLYSEPLHMYADTKMANNASSIDSVGLLPLLNSEGIPFVDESAAVCICPYFQTLSNENIVYQVELYLNGKRFNNRPLKMFNLFPMKGYAGYYFNGPEMLKDNVEIPVGIMNKSYLHEGNVIKVKLYSISEDYMYFLVGQKLAVGVNPVMGAFPAVFTNIFSNCNAIGWFNATSVIEGEAIYHENMFQQ
jgi:hypothetical protein